MSLSRQGQTIAVSLAALALCGACDRRSPSPVANDPPLQWKSERDGSKIATTKDDFAEEITRCYPADNGSDCLVATFMPPSTIRIYRELRTNADVPNGQGDFEGSRVGYSCTVYLAGAAAEAGEDVEFLTESVSSRLGTLKKQTVRLRSGFGEGNRSWKQNDVQTLLADNNLNPNNRWFDCKRLAEIVDEGSFWALSSSAVSRTIISGGDQT